jgi:glutamine amidotransferase
LVHVDVSLQIARSVVLPDPPRLALRREDLSESVELAQHTGKRT